MKVFKDRHVSDISKWSDAIKQLDMLLDVSVWQRFRNKFQLLGYLLSHFHSQFHILYYQYNCPNGFLSLIYLPNVFNSFILFL